MSRIFFIETERLKFSHWRVEDIDLAQSLWGNAEVAHFVSAKGYFIKEEVVQKLNFELSNMQKHGVQYYPLFLRENDEFIGCCGFKPVIGEENVLEFGFYFKPRFWKKGFAKEAGLAILAYAMEELKPTNIYACHHPQNDSSKRALTRLGFKPFGFCFYEPTGLDHPQYRLLDIQE